ncbi:MAG: hypothetical protein PHR28_13920 [candidate division Zixibacteria bacterium]|nr:hypothetical protein [candidate division Zixibacteria bacterium]
MIYPAGKHPDWETDQRKKKILHLKSAVNEMERDVVRLDRQIDEHRQIIDQLLQEQKHVRMEIRRVDTLVADLETGRTKPVQTRIDEYPGATSYRRQAKPKSTRRKKK